MGKEYAVYTYSGKLLSHEKEGNLSLSTVWIELVGIRLSEINQMEKAKYV